MNTIRAYWMERTILTFHLRTALFWAITVRVVVVSYWRCGTTYRPHIQGALNIGPIGCPETSVRNYNYTPRNSPEERSSHLLRCGSLISRILLMCPKIDRKIYTRVGTLIVATIYLQLIQNRYMFRSFTVLQCSYQHCVQPVASDVEVVGYL